MLLFDHSSIQFNTLKERAFNGRWAVVPDDVLPLTAADPDFPVAPAIIEAMQAYLGAGYLNYGPFSGLDIFKESVARHYNQHKGCAFVPEDVLAVNSAAQGMFLVARYLLKAGDEAIIFDPVDFLFKKTLDVVGAKAILCPVSPEAGILDLDYLESLITPRTKLISICNPHNPLGIVYDAQVLSKLAAIAERHRIWVMSDEIWSDIVYDGQAFTSYASVSEYAGLHSFTVYGFSKTFGLAGLRIGAVLCRNKTRMEDFIEQSQFNSTIEGVSTLSQIGAAAALNEAWDWADAFVQHLQSNRDFAYTLLSKSNSLQPNHPDGTYVIFPKIINGLQSEAYVSEVLEKAKVAIVPGSARWFGPGAEGHVRICFSTSREVLEEGLLRLLSKMG
jgi:aspartate/methionine/tyrosine aminotransferase